MADRYAELYDQALRFVTERDALAKRVEALEAQRDEALRLIERLASPNARSAACTEEASLIQMEVEQIACEARRILSGDGDA